jgi:hypothetical protein
MMGGSGGECFLGDEGKGKCEGKWKGGKMKRRGNKTEGKQNRGETKQKGNKTEQRGNETEGKWNRGEMKQRGNERRGNKTEGKQNGGEMKRGNKYLFLGTPQSTGSHHVQQTFMLCK